MDFIRIDRNIYNSIKDLDSLEFNEKYLAMILVNKIAFSYLRKIKSEDKNLIVYKSLDRIDNITGSNRTTYKLVDCLVNAGVLERGKSYQAGVYSKGFIPRIIPSGKYVTVKAFDYMTDRQVGNLRKRLEKMKDDKIEWHRENLINNLILSTDKLKEYVREIFKLEVKQDAEIDEIIKLLMEIDLEVLAGVEFQAEIQAYENRKRENKKIKAKLDRQIESYICKRAFIREKIFELSELEKTGITVGEKGHRHYHALSNTPRELKKCMISTNEKKPFLIQIDIKNSQPFFLLCLILQVGLEIEESIKLHIMTGEFYERLGEIWGFKWFDVKDNHKTRQEVKRLVYSNIFFASNEDRQRSKLFKQLAEKYPLFADAIIQISDVKNKKGEPRTLASLLQEIETKELLPLVRKYNGVGIHDAIIITSVDGVKGIEKITKDLENRFKKKYGLVPKLDISIISERTKEELERSQKRFDI